jgi:hypothetical protein
MKNFPNFFPKVFQKTGTRIKTQIFSELQNAQCGAVKKISARVGGSITRAVLIQDSAGHKFAPPAKQRGRKRR